MGSRGRMVVVASTIAIAVPLSAPPVLGAAGRVPLAGDWEGIGSHGVPLSFALARRHGRLVATSIALGAPLTCPANERDAEAVALSSVSYAGPGAGGDFTHAILSGQAERGDIARIIGAFTARRSGTFTIQVNSDVGCGWPNGTLSWRVHRAHRLNVADGTWTARLTAPSIVSGEVRLGVAAQGRVVQSFRSSFRCRTRSQEGTDRFATAPAYEFIRPDGRFYSPLDGSAVKGHPTLWVGRFTATGALGGTLRIYDSCTRRVVDASFNAAVRSRHGR